MSQEFPADRETKRRVLLLAVQDIAAVVATEATASEEAATLSPLMVRAIEESGLFKLKLPTELGGAEADPVTQLEVIEALAYIYPSAGWVLMTNATGIGTPGAYLPDAGIDVVFGGGRVPRAATTGSPTATAVPVEGGYRVTGQWAFASGAPHAEWFSVGARVEGSAADEPEERRIVIPAVDVRLHSNWQVAGLKGTGSCDVSVNDVFVSDHLTWQVDRETGVRGSRRRGGPIFLINTPGFVSNEHAAFALGVARRALDLVIEAARTKRRGRGTAATTLSDRAVFQRWVGRADLQLRAARHAAVEAHEKCWQIVSAGQTPDPSLEAEMRASAVYCTEVGAEIATQAFRYGGGEALHLENKLQLFMRDMNAGAQHFAVSDVAYENHANFLLGRSEANAYY
jgi:alkylation response protein AidB-like acyl-CoA dehydrogenase